MSKMWISNSLFSAKVRLKSHRGNRSLTKSKKIGNNSTLFFKLIKTQYLMDTITRKSFTFGWQGQNIYL